MRSSTPLGRPFHSNTDMPMSMSRHMNIVTVSLLERTVSASWARRPSCMMPGGTCPDGMNIPVYITAP